MEDELMTIKELKEKINSISDDVKVILIYPYKEESLPVDKLSKGEAKALLDEFNYLHSRGEWRKKDSQIKTKNGYWYFKGYRMTNLYDNLTKK